MQEFAPRFTHCLWCDVFGRAYTEIPK
jgi:hypothetical protein